MSLFLGTKDSTFITSDSYQHTLLIAPTGTGKGISYCIPNLIFCNDSMVVHDINGDNYRLTHKHRESIGQKTYFWNPFDNNANKYNPLDFIDRKNHDTMYCDIEKIARILINVDESSDYHYGNVSARQLFIDTVISIIKNDEKLSFGSILAKIKDKSNASAVSDAVGSMYLKVALEPWNNSQIDNATSSSDFDIQQFRDDKSTLYIIIDNNEIDRLRPVLNFMYQHFFDVLAEKRNSDNIKDKHGIRFFLDDLPTIGRMRNLESGISYLRRYNIGLFLIIQDISQLKSVYKDDAERIINNTSFRIAFSVTDFETAEYISKLCLNSNGFDAKSLMKLDKDEQIVFNAFEHPTKEKKFKYYENNEFKNKVTI